MQQDDPLAAVLAAQTIHLEETELLKHYLDALTTVTPLQTASSTAIDNSARPGLVPSRDRSSHCEQAGPIHSPADDAYGENPSSSHSSRQFWDLELQPRESLIHSNIKSAVQLTLSAPQLRLGTKLPSCNPTTLKTGTYPTLCLSKGGSTGIYGIAKQCSASVLAALEKCVGEIYLGLRDATSGDYDMDTLIQQVQTRISTDSRLTGSRVCIKEVLPHVINTDLKSPPKGRYLMLHGRSEAMAALRSMSPASSEYPRGSTLALGHGSRGVSVLDLGDFGMPAPLSVPSQSFSLNATSALPRPGPKTTSTLPKSAPETETVRQKGKALPRILWTIQTESQNTPATRATGFKPVAVHAHLSGSFNASLNDRVAAALRKHRQIGALSTTPYVSVSREGRDVKSAKIHSDVNTGAARVSSTSYASLARVQDLRSGQIMTFDGSGQYHVRKSAGGSRRKAGRVQPGTEESSDGDDGMDMSG